MSKRARREEEEKKEEDSFALSMSEEEKPKKKRRLIKKATKEPPPPPSSSSEDDEEDEEDSMADFIASEDDEEGSNGFDDAEMAALAEQLGDDSYKKMREQSKIARRKEKAERKRYIESTSSKQRWQDQVQRRLEDRRNRLLKRAETDTRLRERMEKTDAKRRALYGPEKHHPLGFVEDLFFHQLSSLAWMLLRKQLPYKGSNGAMLSDDMGLGKTLVALSSVAATNITGYHKRSSAAGGPEMKHITPVHLVIAPNNLLGNWIKEARERFEEYAMQIVVCHETYTPKWQTTLTASILSEATVVLINYEGLRAARQRLVKALASHMISNLDLYRALLEERDIDLVDDNGLPLPELDKETAERYAEEHLEIGYSVLWADPERWPVDVFLYGWHWAGIILDESGTAKNKATLIFKSIIDLKYTSVTTLSGTPIENTLDELYNMLLLLRIHKNARSIATKKKWNRLVRNPEEGRALSIPSDEIVNKLRRRFLNVLQLRREIHNVNGVNPLAPFVKRMKPDVARAYEELVTVRTNQKNERFYNRSRPNTSVHDMSPEDRDFWDQTLDELVCHEMGEERFREVMATVDDGFYWYTPQAEFEQAFKRVDGWMVEAFGVSLYDLHAAHEAARGEMRRLGIRQPTEPEHISAIVEAIEGTLKDRRAHLPADDPRAWPIKVLAGFPVPKPLLFVARPHALEHQVYRHMIKWAASAGNNKTPASTSEAAPTQTTSAFVCIARARASCGDYRTGGGALDYLDETRGDHWDIDNEEGAMEALHQPTEEEAAAAETPPTASLYDPEAFLLADEHLLEHEDEEKKKTTTKKKQAPTVRYVPTRSPTKYRMLECYINAAPKDDKMVLVTDLIQCFPYLSAFLTARGISNVVITGAMPIEERIRALERFNNAQDSKSPRVLIGSLKILNSGHNLQVANHLIVWRPWWSSAIEEQAKRRILRPGQTKEVHFVYFVLLGTIEELVLARSGLKTTLIDRVVGFDDGLVKTGANYSRPLAEEARLMEFQTDEWGAWADLTSPQAREARSIGALLEGLPKGNFVGQNFKNVSAAEIISADGKMKPVNIARAINSVKGIAASPSSPPAPAQEHFTFTGLDTVQ